MGDINKSYYAGGGFSSPEGYQPRTLLTKEQLLAAMPEITEQNADKYVDALNEVMVRAEIDTPKRKAAFIAQIAVETGNLNDEDLVQNFNKGGEPEDKLKFGRGFLQLTFKGNYEAASKFLGENNLLLDSPELVASDLGINIKATAWYWEYAIGGRDKINGFADKGEIDKVSKSINAGNPNTTKTINKPEERISIYEKALTVFENDTSTGQYDFAWQWDNDHAIIKDFKSNNDTLVLNGNIDGYYLEKEFPIFDKILQSNQLTRSVAIIRETDGVADLSDGDDVVTMITGLGDNDFKEFSLDSSYIEFV